MYSEMFEKQHSPLICDLTPVVSATHGQQGPEADGPPCDTSPEGRQ